MSLNAGARIGAYVIVSPLGEGGMGEVYRARDTKLGREVAVKVLLEPSAAQGARVARFQREAQVLATLNHPHIAAIYGLEEWTDSEQPRSALIMELVEGPTLAERIAVGAIPLDEALQIARQIAEALEAAHELGIIHRDLKPANIKLRPDGAVKVLDFGLAKMIETSDSRRQPADGNAATYSPTISLATTRVGTILGTAAYMSPEQARGRPVDKRADVWAFGVVLYEMLTGSRAFRGDDVSDTLATVLKFDPDWDKLPAETPPSIRRLLKRCLAKDPKRRLRECGSALIDLDEVLNGPDVSQPGAPAADEKTARGRQRSLLPAVAALALAAMAGVTAWALVGTRAPATPQPTRRFTITLPGGAVLPPGLGTLVTLSRDGRTLVYRTRNGTAPTRLFRRSIDQFEAVAISGTEDGRSVALSPDGLWLVFYADGKLKRMALAGGTAQTLAMIGEGIPTSAEWNTADHVVFSTTVPGSGLMQVPAAGGEAARLFKPEGQFQSRYPQSLPGANAVLFSLGDNAPDGAELHVVRRDTGEHRTVLRVATAGRVLPTGHLVFVRTGALWAVPFDLKRLEAVGTPVPVVDGVRVETGGSVQYDVSDEGSLVYIPGSSTANKERFLLFVGPDGRAELLNLPKRDYISVQLSPDQTRVVVQVGEDDAADVWVGEVGRGALTSVTREAGFDGSPIWSPDGKTVVFASTREGRWTLHRKAADGTGEAETLATFDKTGRVTPRSLSADGKVLLVDVDGDIGVVETGGKSEWKPLIQTKADESQPAVSPDGRWIAYRSVDAGGEGVVYLQRFPGLGDRRPVSLVGGGSAPVWLRDGRALFYLPSVPTNAVMRVSLKVGPDGRADIGTPEVFTEWNYFSPAPSSWSSSRFYDVSSDGRRVLMISRDDNAGASERGQINVVLNWFDELQRLVPVK